MKSRAFTLIELLVVISIIALLSGVVLASLNSAREKGRLGAARSFASQVEHIAGDSIVGAWELDDCSPSATAADRSGYANTGALMPSGSGPVWSTDTPSGKGCALTFDGSTQYVSLPSNPSLALGTTFTVSAWVKFSTLNPAGWNFIIAGPTGDVGFGIISASRLIRLTKVNIADAPLSSLPISADTWHHVAGVYNGTTVTYYLDGQSNGSVSWSQTFTTGAKRIGVAPGPSGFFSGYIDDVAVYTKDLTASEIGNLYASGVKEHALARE